MKNYAQTRCEYFLLQVDGRSQLLAVRASGVKATEGFWGFALRPTIAACESEGHLPHACSSLDLGAVQNLKMQRLWATEVHVLEG